MQSLHNSHTPGCVLANTVSGDNISGNVGLLHKMLGALGGSDIALAMVAALAVFPEKREVKLELSMLNILRAITSPAQIIISWVLCLS